MTEGNCEGIGFTFGLSSNALDGVDTTNTTELKAEMIQQSRWCPGCPAYHKVNSDKNSRCFPIVTYLETADSQYIVSITPTI